MNLNGYYRAAVYLRGHIRYQRVTPDLYVHVLSRFLIHLGIETAKSLGDDNKQVREWLGKTKLRA